MSAPATPALCRQIAFFALGPLLCFSLKDLPPLEGMNPDGMVCLAGCAWLMLWWMTEVLPLPVTSLMAVPIFGFLGVMAPDKVFATIGHPAMMLIFGATIIVGVWKESNLIERYAYWCFNLPFVRGNPVRMVLIFTFGAGVMSAIAPNIPLTILFISIAVAIGKSCNLAPDNNMMRSLCTLSAIAPALGGVGTPLGGAPNIVVIAIVATVLGHDITFWEWSALGMPLVFVTLFACFAITALLFPVGKTGKGFSMPEDYLKKKIEALGPVSAHEHAAIWIMVVALALWCSGPQIFSALGLKEEARMMTAPVIAVLMGASAFLVPIRRDRESGRLIFAMNWDQAVRNIGWGIIVLQIGAIAFGQVLLKGGVDKWMAPVHPDASGRHPRLAGLVRTGLHHRVLLTDHHEPGGHPAHAAHYGGPCRDLRIRSPARMHLRRLRQQPDHHVPLLLRPRRGGHRGKRRLRAAEGLHHQRIPQYDHRHGDHLRPVLARRPDGLVGARAFGGTNRAWPARFEERKRPFL